MFNPPMCMCVAGEGDADPAAALEGRPGARRANTTHHRQPAGRPEPIQASVQVRSPPGSTGVLIVQASMYIVFH